MNTLQLVWVHVVLNVSIPMAAFIAHALLGLFWNQTDAHVDVSCYNRTLVPCLNEYTATGMSPCCFECVNTDGSFYCSCPAGFVLKPDGCSCRRISCYFNRHNSIQGVPEWLVQWLSPCSFECVNTDGSLYCMCPAGLVLKPDRRSCRRKLLYRR